MKYQFGENLRYLREKHGIEQTQIAELTGLKSASAVSEWEKGVRIPKIGVLVKLGEFFNVSVDDLVHYDMTQSQMHVSKAKPIPLLGNIAAGSPILADENIEEYFVLDSKIRADFALWVRGDSMIDEGIHDKDIVFLRQQPTLENGEIGAVIINGEATIKKFYSTGGIVILQPANKNYDPLTIHEGDLRIAGKLVAVLNIK